MQTNKIFENYFLLNGATATKAPAFEDDLIGNKVANEINKLMNALPEVIEARDLMNEEDLKDSFSAMAVSIAQQVKASMLEKIPDIVDEVAKEIINSIR